MAKQNITMREVAKRSGVSIATVSKYLDGIKVKEINKKRIEESIAVLGYRRNEIARGLKTNKSYTIGILVPNFSQIFYMDIISYIEDYLQAKGYSIIIASYKNDAEQEVRRLNFLAGKMVDGMIVVTTGKNDEILNQMAENIPMVLIDRKPDDITIDSIIIDNFKAGYAAAEILLKKGHKNIGIITAPDIADTLEKRHQGFVKALEDNNLRVNMDFIGDGKLTFNDAMNAALKILDRPDRPTGIIATNYDMTIGLIMAINKLGLSIPEDISVVGFDNIELSQIIKPELSIIEQPVEQMGIRAGELILQKALKKKKTDELIEEAIPFNIHEGKSVKQI